MPKPSEPGHPAPSSTATRQPLRLRPTVSHPSAAVFEQIEMPGVAEAAESNAWWWAYGALEVVGADDSWTWAGSGVCQLAPADPLGMNVMSWRTDDPRSPATIEIALRVYPDDCTTPVIDDLTSLVETEESVTIAVLGQPQTLGAAFDCHSAPTGPLLIVELTEPLGTRESVDGAQPVS